MPVSNHKTFRYAVFSVLREEAALFTRLPIGEPAVTASFVRHPMERKAAAVKRAGLSLSFAALVRLSRKLHPAFKDCPYLDESLFISLRYNKTKTYRREESH